MHRSSTGSVIGLLAEICAAHPLDEKILIVPSHSIGYQIGEWLTGAGTPWINLRFLTLASLALDIAGESMAEHGLYLLGEAGELLLLDSIFQRERDSGRLDYFQRMPPSCGFIRALRRSMIELRLEEKTGNDVNPGDFTDRGKGRDVRRLMKAWEAGLSEMGALDFPELLKRGAETSPRRAQEPLFLLIFENMVLSRLEERFIRAVVGERRIRLPGPVFPGLERPRRMAPALSRENSLLPSGGNGPDPAPPSPCPDLARMPWLLAPESAPPPGRDGSLSVFCGIGVVNECREALRRILAAGIGFDEAEVLHPSGSEHPLMWHSMSVRLGIPLTFADGLPIGFTSPGRALRGLIDWIERGFPAARLAELMESGELEISGSDCGDPAPSSLRAAGYLRAAGIGWGRKRYLTCLSGLVSEYRARAHRARMKNDEVEAARLTSLEEEIRSLGGRVGWLLDLLPQTGEDGKCDFGELCRRMCDALTRFVPIHQDRDRAGLEALTSRLKQAAGASSRRMLPKEGLKWMWALTEDMTCGASGPRPGCLHIASLATGGWSGRRLTFLTGLNQGVVPGTSLQDPILLDEERRRLDPHLSLSEDRLREELHAFVTLAASLNGRAVLSFSVYDMRNSRPAFPSSLILQAVRLIEGDAGLDYSSMPRDLTLDGAAGFVPRPESQPLLGDLEWWLERLLEKGLPRDGRAAVSRAYPELGRGAAADACRRDEAPGEYEGLIGPDPEASSPARKKGLVFSASRLENLSRCPFGYFLRYILGIEKPREVIYDPDRWLDPMDRGSLLHEVFERFMQELRDQGERPDPIRHAGHIHSLGEEVISRYREAVPPPSESVFENEREKLRQAIRIFLRVESGREAGVEPLMFEAGFGLGETDEGMAEPAEIRAAGGRTIRLRGRIDRLDRLAPHGYRVIDYKTGSAAPYDKFERFDGGRKLQHALYRIAARQILIAAGMDADPEVIESGYAFLSERGEGRERLIGPVSDQDLEGLLGELLDILERGCFLAFPDALCDFCDYAPICGIGAVQRAKDRKDGRPEYDVFRRLREYK